MSDISIPGVTSRINSDKIIEKVMELERVPLDRMERTREELSNSKGHWQDINRKLADLRDTARLLYGVDNPFNERIVESSDPSAVTATATRTAGEGSNSIQVIQTAGADRFLSSSLDRDFTVSEGTYSFTSGDTEISFPFRGGTLTEFSDRLNNKGRGIIRSRVINDTESSQVLLIESVTTGAKNRLEFSEASTDLGLKTGILERVPQSDYSLPLTETGVRPWNEPLHSSLFTAPENGLYFPPDSEAFVPITPSAAETENLTLTIQYRVENIDETSAEAQRPSGPDIPEPGTADFEDLVLQNNPSRTILPPWEPPEEPAVHEEATVFYASAQGNSVELPDTRQSSGGHTLQVPLDAFTDTFSGVFIRNENTHRRIYVEGMTIEDPTRRGEYMPANPITQASDAVLELDGVRIRRGSNAVDDLIPGVTLELREPSSRPVNLEIKPDTESVKNTLINFVGYYNQLLTDIQVLTRTEESIVDNLGYLTDEERKQYMDRLGSLQGDLTLNQLKNRLQRVMMDPQPAENEGEIVLLAQMGISTNAAGPGAAVDRTQMRGYLQINEKNLDSVLASKMDEVKKFFGRDANGDMITDTGLAYTVEQNVRPYTQSGGIITTRLRNIDQQIDRTDSSIETVQERLERKEAELEQQYSRMEGALNELEQSSQALDNFQSQQNQ